MQYIIRKAVKADIPQILSCLSVLSDVSGEPKKIETAFILRRLDILTFVIEDPGIPASQNTYEILPKILGTASLVLISKLSHNGRSVGYIDDVAVLDDYQGLGLGHLLIEKLIEEASSFGCYKVILNCKKSLRGYYKKFGFKKSGIEMRLDL